MVRVIECSCAVAAICLVLSARCDDRLIADAERLRNTPPQLSSTGKSSGQVQPRFLPFSASFSLSAGGNNAQSFSVAGGPNGIGLSQSSSHGSPGSLSASQSSSLAAGPAGISASDSSAIAGNHPLYGPGAHASGNSLALGQASAAAHGDVVNGQAVSGAQSALGGIHSQASSGAQNLLLRPQPTGWSNVQPGYANGNPGAGNYYYHNQNRKPSLTISVSDQPRRYGTRPSNGWYEVPDSNAAWGQPELCQQGEGWYRDPRCRNPRVTVTKPVYRPQRPYPGSYETVRDPRDDSAALQVSAGSAAHSGPGGLSIGQSSTQAGNSNRGPGALTINRVETSGNAQAQTQGIAGGVTHQQQGRPGKLQANLSSATISASSRPGGSAQGTSVASSSGVGGSSSQVTGSSTGPASAQGSANAGGLVAFPGPSGHSDQHSLIPKEFVRSAKRTKPPKKKKEGQEEEEEGPLGRLISDISDTVYDILDY